MADALAAIQQQLAEQGREQRVQTDMLRQSLAATAGRLSEQLVGGPPLVVVGAAVPELCRGCDRTPVERCRSIS